MGPCFASLLKPHSFSGPVQFYPFFSEPPKCLFLWYLATLGLPCLHFYSLCVVGCLQKDAHRCPVLHGCAAAPIKSCSLSVWGFRTLAALDSLSGALQWTLHFPSPQASVKRLALLRVGELTLVWFGNNLVVSTYISLARTMSCTLF